MFELSGRRSDSSQWTQWIPRSDGTLRRCGEVLCPSGHPPPSTFGIIDAFTDEAARETHLGGPVGKALAEKADELFASAPDISNLDVIANKL